MIRDILSCKCRFCGEEAGIKSKKYWALKYSCRNKKCRKLATYIFYVCAKERHILYESFRTKQFIIDVYYADSKDFISSYAKFKSGQVFIKNKKTKAKSDVKININTIENISDLSKLDKTIKTALLLQ